MPKKEIGKILWSFKKFCSVNSFFPQKINGSNNVVLQKDWVKYCRQIQSLTRDLGLATQRGQQSTLKCLDKMTKKWNFESLDK